MKVTQPAACDLQYFTVLISLMKTRGQTEGTVRGLIKQAASASLMVTLIGDGSYLDEGEMSCIHAKAQFGSQRLPAGCENKVFRCCYV